MLVSGRVNSATKAPKISFNKVLFPALERPAKTISGPAAWGTCLGRFFCFFFSEAKHEATHIPESMMKYGISM